MPPTGLTHLEMTTRASQNKSPMLCSTHFTSKSGSSVARNALKRLRVFTFMGLEQVIAQLCDAVLAFLRRQWMVQFSVSNFFCSSDQSPLRPHFTATGLPLFAAQVAELGLAVAPNHCVSIAAR
ncbi:hypothetical protein BDV24DRAFT_33563 [Aspergillus arachidicola]|uniref:Uncharacterized protein n=1 Tax=Aspergillus arachidicola TaxID=656916 RepID=A0A5N6YD63_9EURO|nr:hypothetical protein BDV24DRAFT_33563 [Aspergillus arachidicola]